MKTHTTVGAQMLAGSAFALLELAEQIALTHHEKWDGSGYPAGLVGDAIPIAGRIVAVADVFDALTHARPYKAAWSTADAIAEMTSQAGRHFDPRVVEAFLGLRSRAGSSGHARRSLLSSSQGRARSARPPASGRWRSVSAPPPTSARRESRTSRTTAMTGGRWGLPPAGLLASSVAATCPPKKAPPAIGSPHSFHDLRRTFCTIRFAIAEKERPMPMPSRARGDVDLRLLAAVDHEQGVGGESEQGAADQRPARADAALEIPPSAPPPRWRSWLAAGRRPAVVTQAPKP